MPTEMLPTGQMPLLAVASMNETKIIALTPFPPPPFHPPARPYRSYESKQLLTIHNDLKDEDKAYIIGPLRMVLQSTSDRVNASVCGPRSVTPVDVRSCQCQCLRVAVSERGWARTEEPGGDAMMRTVMCVCLCVYIYIDIDR